MTHNYQTAHTTPLIPHSPHQPTVLTTLIQHKLLTGAAIAIVIAGALGIAANRSLPGESLYSIKTSVLEPIAGATHFRSPAKAYFQVTLLKERLEEAQALAAQDSVREEAIVALRNQSLKHQTDLLAIVENSIDSAFPKTDLLYTVNEFASVAGALEEVTENDESLATFGEDAETMRQDAVGLYKDRMASFVQTETPERVYTYMQDQLGGIQTVLGTPDLNEKTIDSAENYLDRVGPALVKSDFTKALLAIGEAYRIVKTATYSGIVILPEVETNIEINTSDATSTEAVGTTTVAE